MGLWDGNPIDGSEPSKREKRQEAKGFSAFGSLDGGGSGQSRARGTSKHDQRAQPSASTGGGWSFMMGDGRHRVHVEEPGTRWEGEVRGDRGRVRRGWAVDHGDAIETHEEPRWLNRTSRARNAARNTAASAGDAFEAHLERKVAQKDMNRSANYSEWGGEVADSIVGTSRNVFSLAARALARRWF